jgi:hypothetical protein
MGVKIYNHFVFYIYNIHSHMTCMSQKIWDYSLEDILVDI